MNASANPDRYLAYRDAIQRRVCGVCLDQKDDGSCRLAGRRTCAIEMHLPRIVQAVMAVDSVRMDEYIDAIRQQICSDCNEQSGDGRCQRRDSGECGLWTYLPLLVDAIEEVRGSLGGEAV